MTTLWTFGDSFTFGDGCRNDTVVNLEKGDAVLFNGGCEFHEIKPVTEGTRYALNFWFYR